MGFILVVLVVIVLVWIPYRAMYMAHKHDLNISFKHFMGMRVRRIPPMEVVTALKRAKDMGIDDADALGVEVHMLCGGSVKNLMDELAKAKKAGITIPFEEASRMYLRGELAETIEQRMVQHGHVQRGEL